MDKHYLKSQRVFAVRLPFASSQDLQKELVNAIIGALDAHSSMSSQALNSELVLAGLKEILIGPSQLYESLRERQSA